MQSNSSTAVRCLIPCDALYLSSCHQAISAYRYMSSPSRPEHTYDSHFAQALSGQPYDEDAQQSAYSSPAPTGVSLGAGAANSPVSQPSGHVSAQALAAVQHFVSAEVYAGDASVDVQQQTTASNDGLVAAGSYDTQQDAAASVHATALEGNLPGSDGETDLSSVGWQTGKQPRGRGRQCTATNTWGACACRLAC